MSRRRFFPGRLGKPVRVLECCSRFLEAILRDQRDAEVRPGDRRRLIGGDCAAGVFFGRLRFLPGEHAIGQLSQTVKVARRHFQCSFQGANGVVVLALRSQASGAWEDVAKLPR